MKQFEALDRVDSLAVYGRVAQAVGTVIEGYGPVTSIGEMGEVTREDGDGRVLAEVGSISPFVWTGGLPPSTSKVMPWPVSRAYSA